MRRLIWLIIFLLLSLGTALAQESQSPDELLALAVSMVSNCKNSTARFDTLDDGHELKVEKDGEDGDVVGKMSLSLLFKPKRYNLEFGASATSTDGRVSNVIHFTPKPPKEHLEPGPGEDRKYNWGMNRLEGWIFLDQESGEIVKIEAKTPGKQVFKKFIKLAELRNLEFSFEQSFNGARWVPSSSHISIKLWKIFGSNKNSRYETVFDCS